MPHRNKRKDSELMQSIVKTSSSKSSAKKKPTPKPEHSRHADTPESEAMKMYTEGKTTTITTKIPACKNYTLYRLFAKKTAAEERETKRPHETIKTVKSLSSKQQISLEQGTN
jgi:hypothetical protein